MGKICLLNFTTNGVLTKSTFGIFSKWVVLTAERRYKAEKLHSPNLPHQQKKFFCLDLDCLQV